jgi:hypothetical protein
MSMDEVLRVLPKISDVIIVHGMTFAPAKVESIVWNTNEHSYVIYLDWGTYGRSRVYPHDEGEVWYRVSDKN